MGGERSFKGVGRRVRIAQPPSRLPFELEVLGSEIGCPSGRRERLERLTPRVATECLPSQPERVDRHGSNLWRRWLPAIIPDACNALVTTRGDAPRQAPPANDG